MITHVHQDVFAGATGREHIARFYAEDEELARDVARYLHEGARRGESLILAVTPEHWEAIRGELHTLGTDLTALETSGRITVLDAHTTLPRLMGPDGLDPEQFRRIVGGALQSAIRRSQTGHVRAFGELVDLLWQDGDRTGALTLEGYWDELLLTHPFSLLCAYRTGLLDPNADPGSMEGVYGCHTHHVPREDRLLLDSAVGSAFVDILGQARANALDDLVEATIYPGGALGHAERAIFWTRRNLPTHLEPLLQRAREHLERSTME